MTDSFVTQCPQCQTRFRVSRAQLAVAHGAVRCGACLHVFNAAQQLLAAREQAAAEKPRAPTAKPSAAPPKAPPSPAPAAPSVATVLKQPAAPLPPIPATSPAPASKAPAASDALWIHDDLDLDSLDLDEELAKLEQEEQRLSRDLLGPDAPLRADNRAPAAEPDERWADALVAAEEREAAPESLHAREPEIEPETHFELRAEPEEEAVAPTPPEPASPTSRTEPSLGMDLVEDEPGPDFTLGAARDDEPGQLPDEDDEDHDEPHQPDAPRTAAHKRNEPGLREEALLNLNDEPLQLDWQESRRPWGRWIGWLALNLLAALALATQYVWYHFDELARQDQYRPWFQQICPEIGCQLPSKVDINLIKSSNLVVRSHPEFSGALVVDAILYNRAAFAQPFPLLELRFADMNGQLLASRRFKPGEYLSGELAGQSEMPPQTPIHISLDILDPGTKAVNYSLSFHSPD
ncbi:DUF3426 domain-containing protein [Metapseudomonas furukawaii]|uniref:DUF3426 domain-containing protein n=1 Tax=Metapseudomonas furukawaii TaxID=1149133 RepID=UPI00227CD6D7|nr:DUF3426 domain-containing protein [Pseudomonas furukawaii]WAG78514.1 DUF3426 domain-containing protein [Pseudomonas furukawaii]